jgi:hypothetical protein
MRFELRDAKNEGGLIRFRIEKPPGWTKSKDRGPMK